MTDAINKVGTEKNSGPAQVSPLNALNERSREVLRIIVDSYVQSGEPVGSRTISRSMEMGLSPATIRNVMSDLEEAGLLHSPHTSAGRLPTDAGLRMFVDGLLQIGEVGEQERQSIEALGGAAGKTMPEMLSDATAMLSGLSRCAGLVAAPKREMPLKQIEFVQLGPGQALVVMVTQDGLVENRVLDIPPGVPQSALRQAANYLNARLVGRSIEDARLEILAEIETRQSQLDELSSQIVEAGLADWSGDQSGTLIIKGQANLLDDIQVLEDLERVRQLFEDLENQETVMRVLDATDRAEGVQIFIGADNRLFSSAGCSVIVAPYHNSAKEVVGAIGVIGPTRLNYARIIPMVDYTAKVIGKMMG
ncbi:MAG: heat-inducible transcriptional repressor HrcA [Pseudomonadota bacterium]